MQEFFAQAFIVVLMLSMVLFWPIGGYQFIMFLGNETGWQKRRAAKKRDSLPDTPLDKAVRLMLQSMTENVTDWRTNTSGDSRYRNSNEFIRREDGKVTIRKYHTPEFIEIELDAIGVYQADDLKPELANLLSQACVGFKGLIASYAMLQPDKLISHKQD
jgi:hypothetical protein